MSFATLPWWAFLAGIPLLAGTLYLLQRLRSERRFIAFAAASLLARMPRATPQRVRGATFRYWLALLLSLAIALLLWLATANPVGAPPSDDAPRLFYLDASAALIGNEGIATRALLADVRATRAGRRAVVLGDATGTPLLAPGESISLLAARLDTVTAGARPSTFGNWLRERVARMPAGQTLAVSYYGSWGVARAAAANLPATAHLTFGYLAPPVPDNRGIVTLGASPASSGRWGKADVLVGVAGPMGRVPVPADLTITHGSTRIDASALVTLSPGRFLLRDIDANGGELTAALRDGDGFAADDRATLRLPNRKPIKVGFGASVPATIRAVVAADDAVTVTDATDAAVIVRGARDAAGGDTSALVLTAPDKGATFAFAAPGERPGGDLSGRLAEFGLDKVDAAGLADTLHRPIAIDVRQGETRSVAVWNTLFDPRSSFARSPAMPLFVSQALRWLADEKGWTPYAKAGAPLPDQSALDGWAGRPVDADKRVGGETLPGDAGTARIDGQPIAVSLTDSRTTAAVTATPPAGTITTDRTSAMLPPNPVFCALVLVALLVLAGEWVAYQRGRIP